MYSYYIDTIRRYDEVSFYQTSLGANCYQIDVGSKWGIKTMLPPELRKLCVSSCVLGVVDELVECVSRDDFNLLSKLKGFYEVGFKPSKFYNYSVPDNYLRSFDFFFHHIISFSDTTFHSWFKELSDYVINDEFYINTGSGYWCLKFEEGTKLWFIKSYMLKT